jgi:hypothetical protein
VHDWYVGVRNGKVETVWPMSRAARLTDQLPSNGRGNSGLLFLEDPP